MSASVSLWSGSGHAPVSTLRSAYQSRPAASRIDATSFQPELELPLSGLSASRWADTERRLRDLLDLPENWDSYGGRSPNPELVAYAAAQLGGLKALRLPPPTIVPSGDGQILATWRGRGIEVELWFEAPYSETVVIDDETSQSASFTGADPLLSATTQALRRIGTDV